MKYESYIKKITEVLTDYKEAIDSLVTDYNFEKVKVENKAKEMQGKWTKDYIDQYKQESNPISKYSKPMRTAREKYGPTVLHYLELIRKQLDNYFNAPVGVEFSNKINAIKISGLKLTHKILSYYVDRFPR